MSKLAPETQTYLRTLLIAAGVFGALVVFAVVMWRISQVLLVVFAAILLAVLLDGLAGLFRRYMRVGHFTALCMGILLILALFTLFLVVAGPQVSDQVTQLSERLPQAIARLKEVLQEHAWSRALLHTAPPPDELFPSVGVILGPISGAFSTALGIVVDGGIIIVMGVYMAAAPEVYLHGLVLLVPMRWRPRVEEVLTALGHALRWWLVGRIAAMTVVGILTSISMWIVGMPLVLALGLTAGLLSFVPLIGPIVAAIPAVLLALVEDPFKAVYVLGVYTAVQFLEGNFITPMIQRRAVSLPPAVLLTAQVLMGVLFGLSGVLLATPLAVTAIVLIQMLYVQDVLGDSVRVLGQHGHEHGPESL